MEIPKITNINIYPVTGLPRLKAYASITLNNCILIKNIKIIKTMTNKYRIAFSKESKNSPEIIVLLNQKVRSYFEYKILTEYFTGRDENFNQPEQD